MSENCDKHALLSLLRLLASSLWWLVDRGELEDGVAQQCRPPMKKVVVGRRNSLAVLTGSRTVVHGAGDVDTPGSFSHALVLGAELLTFPLFS